MNAPSTPSPTPMVEQPLCAAIMAAVIAADHRSVTLANGTDAECTVAEDAAWTAKQAMLAEFRKQGIGESWVRKIANVL